jgi:hypothetical protein
MYPIYWISGPSALSIMIGFQSMNPRIVQDDKCFAHSWRSVKLRPTKSVSPIDARNLLPIARTTNEPMHICSVKSKGLPIDVPFYSYIFYMCSATYRKQGAPDRRPVLLLYFLHAQCLVQKVRDSQLTSYSTLIFFAHAVPCTKSKGIPIDILFYSYTFYTCSVV